MSDLQEFWNQLNTGPAVLFLGQDYLRLETGTDPLLFELQKRFGSSTEGQCYNLLLEISASQSSDAALTWMFERCRRLSPPEWLQSIARFPWNSVFSSAMDPLWLRAFRNEWREVASIYDDEYYPGDPRNRRMLHCTYLFGSLNSIEPKERPPLSWPEFLIRKQTARNLAQRLPDTLTPLGVLAVEGYKGDADWLTLEDFFPNLQALGQGQVHLFSVDTKLDSHPLVAALVQSGQLVTHTEGLASALEQGVEQGFVHVGPIADDEKDGRRVRLRNRSIVISRQLWNRVSNFATILDDHVLTRPPTISDDALHWEFRRFLYESATRPFWSGFARGFAFKREFEQDLHDTVLTRVGREASTDQPVVIHGQTGTGKTVALSSLAYTVAKSGQYPVIFIERKIQRPVYTDIDECCRWFEDHGAKATLIVWDGMVQQSEYRDIQGYLASRGRKALVVGSSYSLNELGPHLVRVPDQLSFEEARNFAEFLEKRGFSLTRKHREALEKRDPSYLVALYRHLAPTRQQITTGVVQELEQLEQELVASVNELDSADLQLSTLATALLAAGVIDYGRIERVRLQNGAEIKAAEVAELVDIVTVPGRFGINIPIELLARTWGKSNFADIAQIFRNFDLIQAFEDAAGRVVVGPRHSLEAELIVRARLGSVQNEASIVGSIVKAVRPSGWGAGENDEIDFAIELLRAVGPQGDEKRRFAPFFRDLADCISELRESRNIRSPRMMLQEANFYREWVTTKSMQGNRPPESGEILNKAKTTLQEASEMLKGNRQWRLQSYVATELASMFGTATVDSINAGATADEVKEHFEQVLRSVQKARMVDYSAYNPVDVLVWSTREFTKHQDIDDTARTEAIVDVLDALETVDPDLLDGGNLQQFHKRRYEVGNLLGDDAMSEVAFQSLLDMGSAAGYYIRALEIGGSLVNTEGRYVEIANCHEDAWSYLEEHRKAIGDDSRCLNLLFDYWWLIKTGHRLFERERVVLNFEEDDWLYALQLIRDLNTSQSSRRGLTLSFLQAILLFHLDQVPQAMQLFREVESESFVVSSRRRILRSFLASGSNGEPRVFHGNVRSIEPSGRRGQVFVEELRQYVTFLPTDFGRPEIRRGDSLGAFHIAFNFIGPVADPLTRSQP